MTSYRNKELPFCDLLRLVLLGLLAFTVIWLSSSASACEPEAFEAAQERMFRNLEIAEANAKHLLGRGDLGQIYDAAFKLATRVENLTEEFLNLFAESAQDRTTEQVSALLDQTQDVLNETHRLRYPPITQAALDSESTVEPSLPSSLPEIIAEKVYSIPITSRSYTGVKFSRGLLESLLSYRPDITFEQFIEKALKVSIPRGFADDANALKYMIDSEVRRGDGGPAKIIEVVVKGQAVGAHRLFGYMEGSVLRLVHHAQSGSHFGPSWIRPIRNAIAMDLARQD